MADVDRPCTTSAATRLWAGVRPWAASTSELSCAGPASSRTTAICRPPGPSSVDACKVSQPPVARRSRVGGGAPPSLRPATSAAAARIGNGRSSVDRPVGVGDVGEPPLGLTVDRHHRQLGRPGSRSRARSTSPRPASSGTGRRSGAVRRPRPDRDGGAAPGHARRSPWSTPRGAGRARPSSGRPTRGPPASRRRDRVGRGSRGTGRCRSDRRRWRGRANPPDRSERASWANLFTSGPPNSLSRKRAVTSDSGSSTSAEVNSNVSGSTLAKKAASTDRSDRNRPSDSARNAAWSRPRAARPSKATTAARCRSDALASDVVTAGTLCPRRHRGAGRVTGARSRPVDGGSPGRRADPSARRCVRRGRGRC